MTIDPNTITVPASNPTKPVAVPYVRPAKSSAASIIVPAFTPAPIQPKASKPISATTCSGEWPATPGTLAAIKADVDALGPDAGPQQKAYVFIAACIERGIDAGECISALAGAVGLSERYIRTLRHVPNAPWQKGPDGRYRLI